MPSDSLTDARWEITIKVDHLWSIVRPLWVGSDDSQRQLWRNV